MPYDFWCLTSTYSHYITPHESLMSYTMGWFSVQAVGQVGNGTNWFVSTLDKLICIYSCMPPLKIAVCFSDAWYVAAVLSATSMSKTSQKTFLHRVLFGQPNTNWFLRQSPFSIVKLQSLDQTLSCVMNVSTVSPLCWWQLWNLYLSVSEVFLGAKWASNLARTVLLRSEVLQIKSITQALRD